jgi:hypothetical protein
MEFEPTIRPLFEPKAQMGLNPFEPAFSSRTDLPLIRRLMSGLIAFCKKAARTTLRIVSLAEMLVFGTASATAILGYRRKGGSK